MVYLVKLMCYLLCTVLQDGLEKNFNSVKVLVVDCPDLTKEPFFLSAPGKGKVTACLFFVKLTQDIGYIFDLNLKVCCCFFSLNKHRG